MVTPIFRLGYRPLTFSRPPPTRRVGPTDRTFSTASRASCDKLSRPHHWRNPSLLSISDTPPGDRTPRPALIRAPRPTVVLQRQRIPPAGFHHQFLKMPAIPDGALQIGSEFIRHIDRKPLLPLSAI